MARGLRFFMSENVHAFVGIIELAACPGDAPAEVDDSSLARLLACLAEHDSLADELALSGGRRRDSRWRRVDDDSLYDGRVSVSADLSMLFGDLEREYAQLCEALDS